MKPNLKELNLEKLKKIAAKTPRIRVKLTRKHWIFIGCAVVVLAVSGLPRPGGTAVTDHPESHAEIAAPAEAAVPNVDSVEEDTAATAYATQSDEDTADVPDSTAVSYTHLTLPTT